MDDSEYFGGDDSGDDSGGTTYDAAGDTASNVIGNAGSVASNALSTASGLANQLLTTYGALRNQANSIGYVQPATTLPAATISPMTFLLLAGVGVVAILLIK